MRASTKRPPGAGAVVKRTVDILVSAAVLILMSPLLIMAALAIAVEDGLPVLYRQKRVGSKGHDFDLLKFRSMRVNSIPVHEMGQVDNTNPMVTKTGRVLRRLKVDELPQVLNVLRGDMSLVGPRPTVPEQVASYNEFEYRRLEMTPGMTGWAQVNGNATLSWEERILLDLWYIDHWSLAMDARILLRTVSVVVFGEHADAGNLVRAREYARSLGWRC